MNVMSESKSGGNRDIQPAIEGWFTLDTDKPHLIGRRCQSCGTYYFPKLISYCKNPNCDSEQFDEVQLSRTGKIWSYTNNCYKPPAPFVASDPFEPYAIAAVELEDEQMIILGQVAAGFDVGQLKVGQMAELVLETLHEDGDIDKVTWKWKPVTG